jgi:hypothetical protein
MQVASRTFTFHKPLCDDLFFLSIILNLFEYRVEFKFSIATKHMVLYYKSRLRIFIIVRTLTLM